MAHLTLRSAYTSWPSLNARVRGERGPSSACSCTTCGTSRSSTMRCCGRARTASRCGADELAGELLGKLLGMEGVGPHARRLEPEEQEVPSPGIGIVAVL